MAATDIDLLVLDFSAATRLADVMADAATEIGYDRNALDPLLEDATAILRTEQGGSLSLVSSARYRLEDLAAELRSRMAELRQVSVDVASIGDLSRTINALTSGMGRVDSVLRAERRTIILGFVGNDASLAAKVEQALRRGLSVADALAYASDEALMEVRVDAAALEWSVGPEEARKRIDAFDLSLAVLLAAGYPMDVAMGGAAAAAETGVDIDVVLRHIDDVDIALPVAIGEVIIARGLDLTPVDFHATWALSMTFDGLDGAIGGRSDGRVSWEELQYIVDNECRFTDGQVKAAEALLDNPALFTRIDTADENNNIFGGEHFGSTDPGDWLVSESDMAAFFNKLQVRAILGPHGGEIDVANDPTGVPDGIHSPNDLRKFIEDNPDLPQTVRLAAEEMLDKGWFTENWWQEHKDELAMGAALVAGGVLVVVTGGTASILLAGTVGAGAAAGTTIAVNLATGEGILDDVLANSVNGFFIATSVSSVAGATRAYAAATTTLTKSVQSVRIVGGLGDIVSRGGIDLILSEEEEDAFHAVGDAVGLASTATQLRLSQTIPEAMEIFAETAVVGAIDEVVEGMETPDYPDEGIADIDVDANLPDFARLGRPGD